MGKKKDERKCLFCGGIINIVEEEFEKVSNRYAHKICYNNDTTGKVKELKDKKILIDYVLKIYQTDKLPTNIARQIQQYYNEGKTYEGIYFALFYLHNAKKNPVFLNKPTIGIVPSVYDEANEHYRKIREKMEKEKEKTKAEVKQAQSMKTVKIIKKSVKKEQPKVQKRYFKMLDDE